ncbi:MAG: cell division protein FtsQ/DivIB, partial [Acidimicrobiia bacterium]
SARKGLEGVPWVARAAVTRHLPGTVRISVVEREPLATVARAAGGLALVDGSGRVLVDSGERPEGLPHLPGAPEPPAPGGFLEGNRQPLAAVAALSPELRRMVDTSEEVAGLLVLRLRNGTEVRLGGPSELRGKAAALEAVLGSLGDRRVSYVDVRVPTAPAVGPIPEKK